MIHEKRAQGLYYEIQLERPIQISHFRNVIYCNVVLQFHTFLKTACVPGKRPFARLNVAIYQSIPQINKDISRNEMVLKLIK